MNAKGLNNSRRAARRDKQVRPLTADDISAIAKVVSAKLSTEQMAKLCTDLNRSIAIRSQWHQSLQALAPSRICEKLKKLQKVVKLVASQMHEIRGPSGGYNALSEMPSLYREAADFALSHSAKNQYGRVLDSFDQVSGPLRCMLADAETQLKQQQAKIGGKHHQKSVDGVRYIFVEEVAQIYAHTFGRRPSLTKGGPWCYFLAEVLSRCEQKRMNEMGAFDLWRKVKRLNLRKTFLSWAEPHLCAKALKDQQIRRLMRSGILRPSRPSLPRRIRSMA
jgi:hypothetical protein